MLLKKKREKQERATSQDRKENGLAHSEWGLQPLGRGGPGEAGAPGARPPRARALRGPDGRSLQKQGLWTETTRVADTPECGALRKNPGIPSDTGVKP